MRKVGVGFQVEARVRSMDGEQGRGQGKERDLRHACKGCRVQHFRAMKG